MKVALTGTPGTGKTVTGKLVAKLTNLAYLDLNTAIKKEHLYSGYDRKRKSYIADMKKVKNFVENFEKKNNDVLIDGHISHLLPQNLIDLVIVLRCKPSILEKRLKKKRWNKLKIDENVEAELIGIIAYEARQTHKKVFEIDTSRKSPQKVAKEVKAILKGTGNKYKKHIEWLNG